MSVRAILIALLGTGASAASLVRPYWGLLVLAVLYFFRPEPWGAEETVRPVSWITTGVLIGWILNRKPGDFLQGAGWLIVLLAMLTISTAVAPFTSQQSWNDLQELSKVFLAVFLLLKLCDTPRRLAGIVVAMLVGTLYFVKVAVFQWAAEGFSADIRIDAAVGQGGGSNFLAWVFAATLPFLLYKVIKASGWQRWASLGLTPLWVMSIVATGSRGGLLCTGASAFVVLLVTRQKKSVLILSALALGLWLLAPEGYWGRMSTITANPDEMDASTLSRYQHVQVGMRIMRDYPLFGTGLATFSIAKRGYLPEDYVGSADVVAHNTFIQMGSEIGLPYLCVFVMMNAWLVWRLVRRPRAVFDTDGQEDLEWVRVGVLGALAATAVEMCKGDVAHMDFFWWLYGIAFACQRIRTSSVPAEKTDAARVVTPMRQPLRLLSRSTGER